MNSAAASPLYARLAIHLFFLLVSVCMAVPFLMMIIASFSSEQSIINHGFSFLPKQFSVEAYRIIFKNPMLLMNGYLVTITITVIGTLSALLLTALTAYPISRREYRYRGATTFYIFFTMLFSGGLVPFYILMTQYLHLKDTLGALILPLLLSPYNIMIMKAFLDKIPGEIVESAKIDGAREIRIFFRIILPLSGPALATLGLFIAFGYWNDWFNALLYIDNPRLVPLQLLLARIINQIEFLSSSPLANGLVDTSKFPTLTTRMAMAVMVGGPMLILFPFVQKHFVHGVTVGSLKG